MWGEETLSKVLGLHEHYKIATQQRRHRQVRRTGIGMQYPRHGGPPFSHHGHGHGHGHGHEHGHGHGHSHGHHHNHQDIVCPPAVVGQHQSPLIGLSRSLGLRSGENLLLHRRLGLPDPGHNHRHRHHRRHGRRHRRPSFDSDSSSSSDSDFDGRHHWPRLPLVSGRTFVPRRRQGSELVRYLPHHHHHHHRYPRGQTVPRRLIPHHHYHHHLPSRRDLVHRGRSHDDGREPWYGDSIYDPIYDPSSDNGSLFGTDDDYDDDDDDYDDDNDAENGSVASIPTLSSLSRLPRVQVTRGPGHHHHNHHHHRHAHRHGRDPLASSVHEGRGGGINRVPGVIPRDRWRTGWDGDGDGNGDGRWYSGDDDDGVGDHGSYHRRRPSDRTEESW